MQGLPGGVNRAGKGGGNRNSHPFIVHPFTVCPANVPTLAAMKAELNGTVIAQATDDQVVSIEGNWYFAPETVNFEYLEKSPTPYTCPWKGVCQYYTLNVDGQNYPDRAWAYPHLVAGAAERVGRDFSGYVAFSKEVIVS